jgi:hypothetical protein
MLEHITRALYYFEVHLLYASLVWFSTWVLTAIPRVNATTKYWIWVATVLNLILNNKLVAGKLPIQSEPVLTTGESLLLLKPSSCPSECCSVSKDLSDREPAGDRAVWRCTPWGRSWNRGAHSLLLGASKLISRRPYESKD